MGTNEVGSKVRTSKKLRKMLEGEPKNRGFLSRLFPQCRGKMEDKKRKKKKRTGKVLDLRQRGCGRVINIRTSKD